MDSAGKEALARIDTTVSASGKAGGNPYVAVDQASGHAIEYDETKAAHEYDAVSGSFVAEFGNFTEGLIKTYRVAVDNACAIHVPQLTETTTPTCHDFDPANGNFYVAFDDTNASHPPFDVTAFGPLAYSAPGTHKLTVKKPGVGSGKVTSPPPGIDCGGTCSAEFLETQVVTLTETPAPKNEFLGWSGCEAEPSATKCEVTMSKDREVTAEFKPTIEENFPLEVIVEPSGSGEVISVPEGIECSETCIKEFPAEGVVFLEAKAGEGFEFLGWSGCEAEPSATECEVTMTEPKVVEAEFGVEHPLLTVLKVGSGTGTVTSDPAGIDCGFTCAVKFDLNETLTLKAKASEGSTFQGWQGCDAEPMEAECEVEMTKAREVKAAFASLPQTISKPAHPIAYTEATLRGEVQTAELETEYRFEYLTQAQFEEEGESFEDAQHTPEGELAPAETPVFVQAHLGGLEEGTAYRFRLVAVNAAGMAEDEGTFETLERLAPQSCPNAEYRTGLSANLPDCRAYELVTPAHTDGLSPRSDLQSLIGSFNNWLTVQRGEAAGERLSYLTDGTLSGFEGNGQSDSYRAERGAGSHPAEGWQSTLFSPNFLQAANGEASQHGIAPDQLYSTWEAAPSLKTFPEPCPKAHTCAHRRASKRSGRAASGPTSQRTPVTSAPAAPT